MAEVLIADDDPGVLSGLAAVCRALGHAKAEAQSAEAALRLAAARRPDVVLLDVQLPDRSGLEVLPELLALEGAPAVVVMTGLADVPTAVRAMREGAADFLEKPVRREVLEALLERVLRARNLALERDRLRGELAGLRSGPILGRSPAIQRVLAQIQRVASTPRTTVLILGESGSGKELVARAIHEHSARAAAPFVALNCAALSEPLLEAELFGYEPGAFTGGAPKGHAGLVAAAEGGTLFLDEIGELAGGLQAKLLRVLQERTYRRVGATADRAMDVRIVASTHRDLEAMVERGAFREDLYYRINVLSLRVPALRERPEDVPLLATHFLQHFAAEFKKPFDGFSEPALGRLERHPWPGNVRELKNTIERAALLAPGGTVLPAHLGLASEPPAPVPATGDTLPLGDRSLRAVEEALIRRVLEECSGNRSRAARILGINRATLYNKLRTFAPEAVAREPSPLVRP